MTEINDKVKGDYEHKLEAAIIDLRDQQQSDLEALKEELEGQYNAKVSLFSVVPKSQFLLFF